MDEDGVVQGIFDFDSGSPNGYENWCREREARLRRIRETWGVPVGRHVRVRLRDIDGDFEGILEEASPPKRFDRRDPLYLRVGVVDVHLDDVLSISVIERDPP